MALTNKLIAPTIIVFVICSHAERGTAQDLSRNRQAVEPSVTAPALADASQGLQEQGTARTITLKISKTCTIKLRTTLTPTVIDAGIAEIVSFAQNELTLRGRLPGATTLVVSDESGSKSYICLQVESETGATKNRQSDGQNAVKFIPVGGAARIILTGATDSTEELIKLFSVGNASVDDRGMNIEAVNNRVLNRRPDEPGSSGR